MISKKILASVFIIGLLAFAMGWGTYSWFSDTETSTGNKFSAGTIDLAVNGENPLQNALVTLKDMKPCEWEYVTVTLHNVGTNPGDAWMHIKDIVEYGGLHPEPEWETDPNNAINDIQSWITFDLKLDDKIIIHPDDHIKLDDIECVWIYLGNLDTCTEYTLNMSFHLQPETPNTYQGDYITFTIEFLLNQKGAPPPESNRILLENKDENWNPIIGDGIWGIVEYDTSTLTLNVIAHGLTEDAPHQLTLNTQPAPDDNDEFECMASALATGFYQHDPAGIRPDEFDPWLRGYWRTGYSTVLEDQYYADAGWPGISEGIYNIHDKSDPSKPPEWYGLYYSDEKGDLTVSVSAELPPGDYDWIKFIIKEVGGVDETHPYGTSWTPVLMECWIPLFFTIEAPA